MAFFSPKRRVSDAENKLRLLMCLRALGMASGDQLWPFVASLELMEYLPYCLLIDELKKDGAVAQGSHALEGMLYLTPEGERTLALLGDKLVRTDRERIRAAAPAYAARLNERRQASAAYRRGEAGLSRASCAVREGDVPTLLLEVSTPDETLARAAVHGFRACAPGLLRLLYTLPLKDGEGQTLPLASNQEEALAQAAAGHAALCAYGGPECAAAVPLGKGADRYDVLLLLPGREAAQSWAASAAAEGEALAARITELLRAGAREART